MGWRCGWGCGVADRLAWLAIAAAAAVVWCLEAPGRALRWLRRRGGRR
jgi:hypothetical protein